MSERQRTRTLREAEQAIVRYLRAHPDFFNRHPELVETLRIPHLCHPAVSLLEHQVLLLLTKGGEKFSSERREPCRFVPLRGRHGWKDIWT